MLKYLTAGESHGKALVAILEGMPAGLRIEASYINKELKRRQAGFGRGARMLIETDCVEIISGLRRNMTLASPIALLIRNKDQSIEKLHSVLCPRPGHADLAGINKYGFDDIRDVLERASARSTAATVAIGAVCKIFLEEFKIKLSSRAVCIGGESSKGQMVERISEAIRDKDTVGGIFEVIAVGVPAGLGSYAQSDRRLNGRLGGAVMSIPGIKAVEIGLGFGYADKFGSQVHDAIYTFAAKKLALQGKDEQWPLKYSASGKSGELHYSAGGYSRRTNNAGGIEGGVSNGEEIILRACMKPISTLIKPLDSVNIKTKKSAKAAVERSDTCVVQAAGVVAESVCAHVLADAMLEKFGQDCLADIKTAYKNYLKRIR
ncbi:MAG: chorismate synthase [Candidatus Omnitrophota bacterium]|nr:chorismate synthase [Candidatus Omnitrophota bacterium]